MPRRNVEVEALGLELGGVADVFGGSEQVLEMALSVSEIGERDLDVALAGVVGIVDRNKPASAAMLPRVSQEII